MGSKRKLPTVELSVKRRQTNPPPTAYTKERPSPHAFKPGQSGNPGGHPHQNRLLSKSLRVALADRAPKAVTDALGLSEYSSWAQCLAQALLRQAIRGDVGAARLILEASEPRSGFGFQLELDENGAQRPVLNVMFVSSDGNGGISTESQRRIDAAELQFSDDALDTRVIDASRQLGPES